MGRQLCDWRLSWINFKYYFNFLVLICSDRCIAMADEMLTSHVSHKWDECFNYCASAVGLTAARIKIILPSEIPTIHSLK